VMAADDPFDLERFTTAQRDVYDRVLAELKGGRKRTHWMWFVFPQFDGLGFSETSRHYAIKSRAEARAYLDHHVLGPRLRECAQAVLAVEGRSAFEIFGSTDKMKLKSSMTLFGAVADSVFDQVLEKYFQGERDAITLELLAKPAGSG
jgi:uncharacterized protein (DUF1810 family)